MKNGKKMKAKTTTATTTTEQNKTKQKSTNPHIRKCVKVYQNNHLP